MTKQETWKDRLDALPVFLTQITGGGVSPDECIEGNIGDAKYIGSRDYVPLAGVKYHFSFSGSNEGRERLIAEISAELGRPDSFDRIEPRLWHYYWSSESTEIPETKVHKILGRPRIREICQSLELDEEDQRIIDELLAVFAMYIGCDEPKAQFAVARLVDLDSDRQKRIAEAFLQINFEFAQFAQRVHDRS